jgi:molecular chaperone GrpE (heat shock protein)
MYTSKKESKAVLNAEDITPNDIKEDVSAEVKAELVEEIDWKDKYIRSLADYDNMKKFMENKNINSKREAISDIISNVISPIYNDLRRGVKNNIDGCELILNNLKSSLDKIEVSVIDDVELTDRIFNTDCMEALSTSPCIEQLDDTVEEVIDPGFIDNKTGKTIVYAKVIVRKYFGS